jgi:hypothetical protein
MQKEIDMFTSGSRSGLRNFKLWMGLLTVVLAAGMLTGCESKEQKALDQAKQQAAKTGQPQQVISVDKSGTTTTTVVQPPASGQTNQHDDGDAGRGGNFGSGSGRTHSFRGAAAAG